MKINQKYIFILIIFVLCMMTTLVRASGMLSHSFHNYTVYQGSYYKKVSTSGICRQLYYTYKCDGCSRTEDRWQKNDTSHNWGSWETTETPTCTAKGKQERDCKDCSYDQDRELDIDPNNHSISYKYVDSRNHLEYCTRGCTTHTSYNKEHEISGGENGVVHQCTICNTKANSTNGWSDWHYFPGGLNTTCDSELCTKRLTITKVNYADILPVQGEYYMIGAGGDLATSWETPLDRVEITFSCPPYIDRAKNLYSVTYTAKKFNHGNWESHAKAWAECTGSNLENIWNKYLVWPSKHIQQPLNKWGEESGAFLRRNLVING